MPVCNAQLATTPAVNYEIIIIIKTNLYCAVYDLIQTNGTLQCMCERIK